MSGQTNPVIQEFIEQYITEKTIYERIRDIAQNRIKKLLEQKGIMAIVTARVKQPDRLEEKLINRNAKRIADGKLPYQNSEDIFEDIPDLVGARIALYFPGDATKIGKLLSHQFELIRPKEFPEKVDNFDELVTKDFTAYKRKIYPGYEGRRFDGYCAVHHRVKFADNPVKSHAHVTIEIQVASVLMHAWSEVEHDLAYKKKMGDVTREEYECLDEINGLVMAGEIALNRLNQLSQQRMQNISAFDTHYTLAAYLSYWQKEQGIGDQPLGNVEILFDSYKQKDCLTRNYLDDQLNKLKRLGESADEPLADQLLDIFSRDDNRTMVKNMISRAVADINELDAQTISEAKLGKFLGKWNVLEDKIKKALRKQGYKYINRPEVLQLVEGQYLLSVNFGKAYNRLRHARNKLVHGYVVPSPSEYDQLISDIEWMERYLKDEFGV